MKGLTLIELVISISISLMIAGTLYFSMRTAIESWEVTKDQLVLQHVLSKMMEELSEGLPENYGIRDALEIVSGAQNRLVAVMPWTDSTHQVSTGIFNYTLNKYIKPGTGIPIAEAFIAGQAQYKTIPIRLVDPGRTEALPQVVLGVNLPAGSPLRFTYIPDHNREEGVTTGFRYDASNKSAWIDDQEGPRDISKNPFGVKITDLQFRYFNNTNTEINVGSFLANTNIPLITGIEILIIAQSQNGNTRQAKTFISLRNAPLNSGNLSLREESQFPIPDSKEIKALLLTNLYGINNDDELILEARPKKGKDWRINITFSKLSGSPPLISNYSIECPPGQKVFSDRPLSYANLGLNLLSLGPNGLYDYDDDGLGDSVILEGDVVFKVVKMDIAGASLFVKP